MPWGWGVGREGAESCPGAGESGGRARSRARGAQPLLSVRFVRTGEVVAEDNSPDVPPRRTPRSPWERSHASWTVAGSPSSLSSSRSGAAGHQHRCPRSGHRRAATIGPPDGCWCSWVKRPWAGAVSCQSPPTRHFVCAGEILVRRWRVPLAGTRDAILILRATVGGTDFASLGNLLVTHP